MSRSEADADRDPARLSAGQYRTDANLRARASLHERFGRGQPWHPWVFDKLPQRPRLDVLELGCGPAQFWHANKERIPPGWNLTLTDASPGMLTAAQSNLRAARLTATTLQLDASELERDERFPSDGFDVVLANHMLYHVPDLDAALRGIRRVLRPGGTLLAATNGRRHLQELRALAHDELPAPHRHTASLPFNLENGEALLSEHFRSVTLYLKEDVLRVTDESAVVTYVASMAGVAGQPLSALPQELASALDSIGTRVRTVIREHGAFTVQRAAGLFEATK